MTTAGEHPRPRPQTRNRNRSQPRTGPNPASAILAAVVGVTVLTSCGIQPKGAGARTPQANDAVAAPVGSEAWAFAPARVRLHPLSRIARGQRANERIVEAHVELLDRWGHGTKGLGTFVFELHRDALESDGASRGQEQINLWNLDLTNPDTNARAFDRVTRTYRATLTGVAESATRAIGLTLRVTFRTHDGRQLTASLRLEEGS